MGNGNNKFKKIVKTGIFNTGCCYAFNKYVSSRALLKNILNKANGKKYEWKYGNIYYEVTGQGDDPILLIHDADVISSGYEWKALVPELVKDHVVYILDLPGCGRSEKPGLDYTNYFNVLMIRDFISDVIGDRTEIVTSGFSASFAVSFAAAYPDRVSRLVMINPPSLDILKEVPSGTSKYINMLFSVPIFGRTAYYLIVNRKNIEYQLEENCYYNPFKLKDQTIDAAYEAAHYGSGSGRYFWGSLQGKYLNMDIRRSLALLALPTRIIYGKQLAGEIEIAKSYKQFNNRIDLAGVDMSKKLPHIEKPQETAALL